MIPNFQVKEASPWRWIQLARYIRTKTSTQHHVLLVLVQYADLKGTCWPSYDTLLADSRIGSRSTITAVIEYLRDDLKILNWVKGHGNQYKQDSNHYSFDFEAMVKLVQEQKAEEKENRKVAESTG